MVSVATSPTPSLWRQILTILKDVSKRNPWPLVGLLILIIIGNSRTGLYVLALAGITQALMDQDQGQAILWAMIFIISGLIEQLYWPFKNHLRSIVEDDAALMIQSRVLRKAGDVPLEMFENASFFNKLTRANDDLGRRATLILAQAFDVLQVVIMFVSLLAPVWFIDPRIVGLIVIGCVPTFIVTWRTALEFHKVKTRNAPHELFSNKLSDLLIQRDAAAELRLFGTGQALVRRWMGARTTIADDSVHAVGMISRAQLVGEVFTAIGLGGALALLVRNMLDGEAQLGSLVAVIFSITWGVQIVSGIAEAVRLTRENGTFLGDIFVFEQEAEALAGRPTQISRRGAMSGPMRVGLRNASFRYPGSEREVVRDVNLELEPGEHIALLGENGAGKSTLVRLIAGLYAPSSGEVLLDGGLAESGRADIGAVFQDFVRWQLPLRDNVGFGDVNRENDDAAVMHALERANLGDLPAELDGGLDAWLGREFGDRDLSGGQWQRVAIARAFFRESRLLILDEPTAALDPLAEQRLFERFRDLAAGKTTLTISHRIGPARTADRIVVMDQGEILEIGTHESLMAANGAYAGMYRAQAEWYRVEE